MRWAMLWIVLVLGCAHTVPYERQSQWAQQGITELTDIELNGLEHAALIRGTDLKNPILLFVHGAGVPSMCFAHLEYAQAGGQIEKKFTVVHYDQRGYGKTYARTASDASYAFADYVRDAEAMVVYLRKRFGKAKIYVLAESWGTLLATQLASNHPEWLFALISVGQVADVPAYVDDMYDYAITHAKADSNQEALLALQKAGKPLAQMPPEQAFEALSTVGDWMDYYQMKEAVSAGKRESSGAGFFFKSLWDAPEYSLRDFGNTAMAFSSTQRRTINETLTLNLRRRVPTLAVPTYVFMGEHDLLRRSTRTYFDQLKAPRKEWIDVPGAGHRARGDAPEFVEGYLFDHILPDTYVDPSPGLAAAGSE